MLYGPAQFDWRRGVGGNSFGGGQRSCAKLSGSAELSRASDFQGWPLIIDSLSVSDRNYSQANDEDEN